MPEGNPPEPAPAPAPAVHHVGPIEFEDILAATRPLGHRVFDRGNFNLNVVGIRRTATRPNAFKDVLISITNARGINIHRANPSNCTVSVDEFSASCQVFRCAAQFDSFVAQVRQSQRIFGNSFTYTLLADEL